MPMSPQQAQFRLRIVLLMALLVLGGGRLWAGESSWYVTARFGASSAETDLGARNTKQIDDEAGAAAVEIGYEVNRYLAVEAGYQNLGSHAGRGVPCLQTDDRCLERLATLGLCAQGFDCTEVLTALDADFSGLSLALVPSWPVNDRFSLQGKVGLISWDGDVTAPVFGTTERFSGEDLLAGLGVEYSFPSGLGILAQHEELDLDVGATSLGIRWRF
jgi:hypothetical protein